VPPPPAPTIIESNGSTSLVLSAGNYLLNPVSGGTGPELKYNGAPVTAGQFNPYVPIAAEQTASGYEIALKDAADNLYSIWNTDSTGNFLSFVLYSGNSTALEALEPSFHQDLNGDGVIGVPPPPPPTVIEALGVTALVEVGNNFFLNPVAGGTGPELKYGGNAVTAGQFATWTPVGAEQTATGYDVAWHDPANAVYTVWSTDTNGNYVTNIVPPGPGNSTALESIETTFHQDLNGDGIIGIPATTLLAAAPPAIAGSQTFDGTTLTINNLSSFNGQIVGFTGDGTLAGSDKIDLQGFNFNFAHSSFDAATGLLAVSDGSATAKLQFLGHYSHENFQFADDGNGGTIVYASSWLSHPSAGASETAGPTQAGVTAGQDTFVFAPHFGQVSFANFAPQADTIQFNKTVFADINALVAAAHDDSSGNAVITDSALDTITFQHLTTAQLLAHQNDFHFV